MIFGKIRGIFGIILGIFAMILPAIGIYGFYSDNFILLYIGAAAAVFINIVGICTNQLKSLYTVFLACIIGVTITGKFLVGCCIGICFESIIASVFGYFLLAVTFLASKRRDNK